MQPKGQMRMNRPAAAEGANCDAGQGGANDRHDDGGDLRKRLQASASHPNAKRGSRQPYQHSTADSRTLRSLVDAFGADARLFGLIPRKARILRAAPHTAA